jgi:hypothetical protein
MRLWQFGMNVIRSVDEGDTKGTNVMQYCERWKDIFGNS